MPFHYLSKKEPIPSDPETTVTALCGNRVKAKLCFRGNFPTGYLCRTCEKLNKAFVRSVMAERAKKSEVFKNYIRKTLPKCEGVSVVKPSSPSSQNIVFKDSDGVEFEVIVKSRIDVRT